MVGDSLGLVLVIPVNKDARRAGEMDQIAFEIDVFRSGLRKSLRTCYATSDRLFLSFPSASGRRLGPCSEMFLLVSTRCPSGMKSGQNWVDANY